MARYKYVGRDLKGKKSGSINVGSKRDALLKLREKGIKVTEIKEIPETLLTKEISFGSTVKSQQFVIFLREFATLIRAGVSLVDSTAILAVQTESKPLKRALLDIEQDLRSGLPLSDSAAKHKRIFTNMFVNMVRAGEVGGRIDETLDRLAGYYEKQHDTKQKIISALMYPAVLAIVAIGVVIFLLVSVVPTFVDMFNDFGGELPAITKFVMNASDFMQMYWWLIVLLGVALVIALFVIRSQKKTRYYFDYVMLRIPVFGKVLQKAVIARMTRTLGSLFSSSVPILESMRIVGNVVDNEVISRVIRDSHDSLEKGQSLTVPMKGHWVFPPLVSQMIAIGEESGSLDAMLDKVADFYEKEVETATDRLKSLIEPVMIIILAALVGTIVLSIILPMFEIYQYVG
nr:type II secretion system F family protein [uncultured Bacillus sp.]